MTTDPDDPGFEPTPEQLAERFKLDVSSEEAIRELMRTPPIKVQMAAHFKRLGLADDAELIRRYEDAKARGCRVQFSTTEEFAAFLAEVDVAGDL